MADLTAKETTELAAVDKVYDLWRTAILKLDLELMLSLFDETFDGLVFQAEEEAHGITTYEGIAQYWRNLAAVYAPQAKEWRETRPKQVVFLDANAALIWTELATTIQVSNMPKSICGGLRFTLGLRKRANGQWAIVHYHESRQVVITEKSDGTLTFLPDVTLR